MACVDPMKNQNFPIPGENNCGDNSSTNKRNLHNQDEVNKSIFTTSVAQCLENKLNSEMSLEDWENGEKCQQLIFKYYMKSEDLENKCTILHRNLQDVKDAWDRAKKVRDDSLKEKENMTIKYATSEKKVLDEKRMKEKFQKKCDDLTTENKTLQHKLQAIAKEKSRINNIYNDKIYEHKNLQSENNRVKQDNCILQNELKLCQKAIKNQAELYAKAQTLENLGKIEYADKLKPDARASEEATRNLKESENSQGDQFEKELLDHQTLQKMATESKMNNKEKQVETYYSPLRSLELKYEEVMQKHSEQIRKIEQLEREKLETTKAFEIWIDPLLQNTNDLPIRPSELNKSDMHPSFLHVPSEQLKALNAYFSILKTKNKDLEIEIETYRHRESEALLFTQHVTDMAMKLQSDYNILKKKSELLRVEEISLKKVNVEYESQCDTLMMQLREEKEKSHNEKMNMFEEINSLRRELSLLHVQNAQLKQQIYDWQEEITILKRKHKFSLREMQKQLISKNNEVIRYEFKDPYHFLLSNYPSNRDKSCSNEQVKVIQPEGKIEPQTFIERIVKLQKINARKSEKLDFLKDQVNTLISELQKKSKLLQIYMLRDRTNALTSNEVDDCKNNLANGIMASINRASVADKHLTLDLSLQINQKLQAVLEDALLENIILKGNIDTLGYEIDKLNAQLERFIG